MDRTKYMDAKEVKQLRGHAEAAALLDNRKGRIRGAKAWLLVDLALSTGLRVSEQAALQVSDIDFRRCSLTVTRCKKKHPKSESLAIDKALTAHLKQYLQGRKAGALFIGKAGDLTTQGLQQIWKVAVRQAGLPKMSIHSARHTLATHLLRKTNNLRQVQKQLGHSSPATTANMYADVSFADMQSGLNGLYA